MICSLLSFKTKQIIIYLLPKQIFNGHLVSFMAILDSQLSKILKELSSLKPCNIYRKQQTFGFKQN